MLENFFTSSEFLWTLLRAVSIICITILITQIFRKVWRTFGKNTIHHKFAKNAISVVMWVSGIVFALSRFDAFSNFAAALIAGSGIAALIIGLAAQESFGNAFNGMFISMVKPFEIGDRIHLINADVVGFVEDITIRHTVIRTFTNSRIIIPNSTINRELIENANYVNPRASNFIDVVITYDSDVAKACAVIATVIGNHPAFVDTRTQEQLADNAPKVPVFVRALGLFGVELRASMWTATISVNFSACSDVRREIIDAFSKEGIRIASGKLIDPLIEQ
ncbi:MAG: mechanosensitive ion channel family protein [Oscillospiraceae bacterium]|nr:mechanosensitive ion channel family protein [Oscillospiraceae bacterium]